MEHIFPHLKKCKKKRKERNLVFKVEFIDKIEYGDRQTLKIKMKGTNLWDWLCCGMQSVKIEAVAPGFK